MNNQFKMLHVDYILTSIVRKTSSAVVHIS